MDDFGLFLERVNLHTSWVDWYRREFGDMWRMNTQVVDESVEKSSMY